jgi:UMF1 family MFS transporter
MKSRSPAIAAWLLWDAGAGAFNTIVSTFVIATYYVRAVAPDPTTGATRWAWMQSLAGLAIALLAVPWGALADRGRRRALLGAGSAVVAVATLALWWVRPAPGFSALALGLTGLATIAFELAFVAYNAMLPALASPARRGRLSMLGWGMGYVGGLLSMGLCLVLFILPHPPRFGLDAASAEPVRACALLAGGWFLLLAWPAAIWGPNETAERQPLAQAWRDAWHLGHLRLFLLARVFTIDGLTTLFAFGGIYAAAAIGLDQQGVLLFGIALNLSAGLGALAASTLEDRIGAQATAIVATLALALFGAALLLVHDHAAFWALGLALGLFVGPAQAASRSLMAAMAPADKRAAWFGLFALSGRVTGFAGPAALGAVTAATGSLRLGMATIVAFLLMGAALLARLRLPAPDIDPPGRA